MTLNRRSLLAASALGLAACAPKQKLDASTPPGTTDAIKAAEGLFGVDYTDKERSQLAAGFEGDNAARAGLRAFEKPNGLAPAGVFDPRLPGVDYPEQSGNFTLSQQTISALPQTDEDIAYAGIAQQSHWISTGVLSSERLTKIYLARIEKYGPQLECFITVMADSALAQARQADREIKAGKRRSPLHGIPYGAKDLFDTKGVKTTYGAEPFKDRVPDADATVITKLNEAGAVLLGKTTLGALAYGDIWFGGVTRNPWNPNEGSSGSSAGSSSSVAAGLCSFALGTETLGSIISPSTRCGIVGLRPSFGRVSRARVMALCWSMDKVGPLTRKAEDTALVLSVIGGYDVDDTGSVDMGFDYNGGEDLSGFTALYDPAWFENADASAVRALEVFKNTGIKVVERKGILPDLPYGALSNILLAEAAAAFEELTLDGRDDLLKWQEDAAWPNTFRGARFISAIDLIQTDRLRRRVMEEMHKIYEEADMLISPPFASPLISITNYTGSPCAVMPCGLFESPPRSLFGQTSDEQGDPAQVPTSIVLWGKLFEDGRLIRAATALHKALGTENYRPPLFV